MFSLDSKVNGLHCARYVILSELRIKRRGMIDAGLVLFNAVVSRNVTRQKC